MAQLPNLPLAVFLVAGAWRRFGDPEGLARTITTAVGTGALLWWAAAEVLTGVNPFRRLLGAVVGAGALLGLVLS